MLFEARGQFREAEASFKLGELRKRAAIKGLLGSEYPPSESSLVLAASTSPCSARRERNRGRDGSRKPRSMRAARCCRS